MMQKMQKKLIYLFVTAFALCLWGWEMFPWQEKSKLAPKNGVYQEIMARKTLNVGMLKNPISYFETEKGAKGLDYDLSQAFAHYLGVKLAVQIYPSRQALLEALKQGKIDIAASNLLFDPEKTAHYALGPAYYSASWQLVYRKGQSEPKNLDALKGKLVVAKDSGINALLKNLKAQYPHLSWQVADKTEEALMLALAKGEIDYTIANSMLVSSTQNLRPNLAVAFDIDDETTVHWYLATEKENLLQSHLLNFMRQASEDGTLARLEENYLNHLKDFNYLDTRAYLKAIAQVLPKYQEDFEKYHAVVDWRLLAAIAYQESHWNPEATSPTGVRGIMMLTRATAEYMHVKNRLNPQESIRGGANYLQFLLQRIPESVPEEDRIWYALAGYNMGFGHLLDVMSLTKKLGGDPNNWLEVKNNLPLLGKREYYKQLKHGHARGIQAFTYVENIRRYWYILTNYQRIQAQQALELAEEEKLAVQDNLAKEETGKEEKEEKVETAEQEKMLQEKENLEKEKEKEQETAEKINVKEANSSLMLAEEQEFAKNTQVIQKANEKAKETNVYQSKETKSPLAKEENTESKM